MWLASVGCTVVIGFALTAAGGKWFDWGDFNNFRDFEEGDVVLERNVLNHCGRRKNLPRETLVDVEGAAMVCVQVAVGDELELAGFLIGFDATNESEGSSGVNGGKMSTNGFSFVPKKHGVGTNRTFAGFTVELVMNKFLVAFNLFLELNDRALHLKILSGFLVDVLNRGAESFFNLKTRKEAQVGNVVGVLDATMVLDIARWGWSWAAQDEWTVGA